MGILRPFLAQNSKPFSLPRNPQARKSYPDKKIWITNEIIHNPTVNRRMEEMNVKFIQESKGVKDFSGVTVGDVVILPAFGASVQEMKFLYDRNVRFL